MILTRNFFRKHPLDVAEGLIGSYLVRKWRGKIIKLPVHETEAYLGSHDKASHASKGKTKRSETMFGPPGHFYIYLTYGMHWMLNIVTEKEGVPSAVLLRGAGPYNGPAKLTKGIHVTKSLNKKPAVGENGLWFEKGKRPDKRKIMRLPRVGVEYAGSVWAKKPYRFLWEEQ